MSEPHDPNRTSDVPAVLPDSLRVADPRGTTDHLPDPHSDRPSRATDQVPIVATPGPERTSNHARGSSVDGGTGAYVPGQGAETLGAVPGRAPGTVSVPGYEILGELGRGGMG